jgi:3-hydroxy-9,10-secoandrosta-1,3,5(10)-triene-9,17-dione monooxygenase reductase component
MAVPLDAGFREAMGRWATGVSVVTARDQEGDAGLTVNALLSVSLHPPSLLVSLTRDADTTPVIEQTRAFAVNFLADDQRPLSDRFARTASRTEKFAGLPVHRSPDGLPLLDGCLGAVTARVVQTTPAYDHLLILGEVTHLEPGRDAPPLLFYRSAYGETIGPDTIRLSRRPA